MATVIGYGNQTDDATLSGGSWDAAYPLTHLKNRYLFQRARTTDNLATSSQFVVDTGENQTIGLVALVRTNITLNGTVRVKGFSDAGLTTLVYDSGNLPVTVEGEFAHHFAPSEAARYWQVLIVDTVNPAGYIEIGRAFVGWRFMPAVCQDWGMTIGVESQTVVMQALAGPEFFDSRPNRRVLKGQWSWLTQTEAHDVWLAILRAQDVEKEVYIMMDTDFGSPAQTWFLGRLRELSAVEWPYLDRCSAGFEIGEVL